MNHWITKITLGFCLILAGCFDSDEPIKLSSLATIEAGEDNSYSNIYRVSTKHLHLDLDVNFENKSIYGIARHEIENNHADTAIFDIKGLQIQKVTLGQKGNEKNTSYLIGVEDSVNGAPLSVLINPKTRFINIYYQTTDQTKNIHWKEANTVINPPQDTLTSDSLKIITPSLPEMMYTLPGEAFARNWIPLQDINYKKISYSATIKVPKGYLPLMGTVNPTQFNDSNIYSFKSTTSTSVYDIGLNIGKYKYKKLSKNIGVYFINKTNKNIYKELKIIPSLISDIEKKYGKSPWKVTNFILRPPSSPYHSYSFSCNYFIHPSLFSKYLNSTYSLEQFLLSNWPRTFFSTFCKNNNAIELGISNYYLNRFLQQNYGKEQAELAAKYYINSCLLVQKEHFIKNYFPSNVYTKNCNEKGIVKSKEIAFKQLKGFLLMKSLETSLGVDKLDYFVKNYLQENQDHSLADFERALNHFLVQEEVIHFPLKSWLYSPRITTFTYKISSKRHLQIHVIVKSFLSNKKFLKLRKSKATLNHFTQFDWLTFISLLPAHTNIKKIAQLDAQYHLSNHPNRNIQFAWIRYGRRNHYPGIEKPLQDILSKYGDKSLIESFE